MSGSLLYCWWPGFANHHSSLGPVTTFGCRLGSNNDGGGGEQLYYKYTSFSKLEHWHWHSHWSSFDHPCDSIHTVFQCFWAKSFLQVHFKTFCLMPWDCVYQAYFHSSLFGPEVIIYCQTLYVDKQLSSLNWPLNPHFAVYAVVHLHFSWKVSLDSAIFHQWVAFIENSFYFFGQLKTLQSAILVLRNHLAESIPLQETLHQPVFVIFLWVVVLNWVSLLIDPTPLL